MNDDGSGTVVFQFFCLVHIGSFQQECDHLYIHPVFNAWTQEKIGKQIWNCFKNNFETVCDSLPATYIFALPF
ncbi:hypothetical protein SAMN05660236_4874 [Ohtaekwangia koreensis]|uniref:Uncharacterized protein n=1 Tax=Ohtaekwangia koreensis TaxID=688867 RepID=A0A1T5MBN8_9BACT|nr:hypothetical protein SAMN05660236_4874 [Ohtaekwangia koreensis]